MSRGVKARRSFLHIVAGIRRKKLRRGFLSSLSHETARFVGALTLLNVAMAGGLAQAQPSQTDIVHLPDGDVQGIHRDGIAEFLGIPYAAPPVGDLRWRPPQNPEHWSHLLHADKFANTCAQPQRGVFAAPSTAEDCLYLNVFTPQSDGASSHRRPVMVWFHGGGLFSGESNDYDGSKLAKRGGVVLVTLNYRVGAFGFFSHPAINAEGHASINYGIMDQQFALKWVQRNIAAFDGDAGNVTIFGQSAGGTSVMANLASPKSDGLFQRAIVESGVRIGVTPPPVALKAGEDLAAAAGCTDQSAKCLRSLSVEQILNNESGILKYVVDYPSVDGTVVTKSAFEAYDSGHFNRVPILAGVVADEQAFFLPELNTHKPLTADEYKAYAKTFGESHVEALLNKYQLSNYASPSLAEIAMAQALKSCTARLLDQTWSKYVPVYAYEFRDRTAPSYFPAVSYPMKAYHTSELQYLFPLFHGGQGTPNPLNAAQEKLSDAMVDYWTTFARTGVPDHRGDRTHAPWSRYSPNRDNVQALNLPAPEETDAYGKANDCDLWNPIVHELAAGTLH